MCGHERVCVCEQKVTVEQENTGVQDRCAAVKATSLLILSALPKVTDECKLVQINTHTHTPTHPHVCMTKPGIVVNY